MTVLALLAALSLPARADVPPENSDGCEALSAGDTCTDDAGANRTCVTATCSGLDYSQGTPPGTYEYECLLCEGPKAESGCGVAGGPAALAPLGLLALVPFARRRLARG